MPTYGYECIHCKRRFEREQGINDPPIAQCPYCRGPVKRLIEGGAGIIMRSGTKIREGQRTCSLEESGRTCCGRAERCGAPPCRTRDA